MRRTVRRALVRRLPALALALLLVPALPPALAAAPAPMIVSGVAQVNGDPAAEGTRLEAYVGSLGPYALASVAADGSYALQLPADDPATTAREGFQDGEDVAFVLHGGRALAAGDARFAAGANRTLDVAFFLPDVALESVALDPTSVAEGENVTITGRLVNRGGAAAEDVVVEATDLGRALARAALGDLAPGASRPFSLTASTLGFGGNRTWVVEAEPQNGRVDPAAARASAPVRVEPEPAPRIRSLAHVPPSPAPGEPVTLLLDVEDDDGIAYVRVAWSAGNASHELNLTSAPWQAPLGAFPAGTRVRYTATVVDASPLAKSATLSRSFDVRAPATPPTGDAAGAGSAEAPSRAEEVAGVALLGALGAAVVGLALLGLRGRR